MWGLTLSCSSFPRPSVPSLPFPHPDPVLGIPAFLAGTWPGYQWVASQRGLGQPQEPLPESDRCMWP